MNERGYSEGTMKLSVERETEGRFRETGDREEGVRKSMQSPMEGQRGHCGVEKSGDWTGTLHSIPRPFDPTSPRFNIKRRPVIFF